jgi:hypothetical protein
MRTITKWRNRAFNLLEKADAMGDLLNTPSLYGINFYAGYR